MIHLSSDSFYTINFLKHAWTQGQNQPAGTGRWVSRAGAQAPTLPSLSVDPLLVCNTFSDPSGDWEGRRDPRPGPAPKAHAMLFKGKANESEF